jgi:hypothetical protein
METANRMNAWRFIFWFGVHSFCTVSGLFAKTKGKRDDLSKNTAGISQEPVAT